eukprot:8909629-Alexandrium_andersonii.AAC.1
MCIRDRGKELEEDAKTCSLDQLLPEEFRKALDDKMELQSYMSGSSLSSAAWVSRSIVLSPKLPPPTP